MTALFLFQTHIDNMLNQFIQHQFIQPLKYIDYNRYMNSPFYVLDEENDICVTGPFFSPNVKVGWFSIIKLFPRNNGALYLSVDLPHEMHIMYYSFIIKDSNSRPKAFELRITLHVDDRHMRSIGVDKKDMLKERLTRFTIIFLPMVGLDAKDVVIHCTSRHSKLTPSMKRFKEVVIDS